MSGGLAPPRPFHASEVNDHVRRTDDGEVLVGGNAEVGIAVERVRIRRLVVGNLGPNLDLGRGPVLPADAGSV
jgi:hypothetical protein